MFAFGKCLKRDGWIISVYRGARDPYDTIKVKKVKDQPREETTLYLDNELLKLINDLPGN
jgi:hypothetical protein